MKKNLLLSVILFSIIGACTPIKVKESYNSMADFYQTHTKKAQTFTLDASLGGTITGKEGTTITFPPLSFVANSSNTTPITGQITIELTEFYTLKDMMYANIHTFDPAEKDLLITGGSIHLKATQNEQAIHLYSYDVVATMPDVMNINDSIKHKMEAFTAHPSSSNTGQVLDWSWSLLEGPYLAYSNPPHYDIQQLQMGWTNCDAFLHLMNNVTERTQFKTKFKNGTSKTELFMFVKGLPCIVKIYTPEGEYLKTYDNVIPKGIKATLVAVSSEGELKFGSKEIEVKGDDVFEVKLKEGTTDELSKLIDSLN